MTAALEGGEWSAARPGSTLPSGKTRYPFYRKLGGPQGRSGRAESLLPTGIRFPDLHPVAQSLYRLRYHTHDISSNYIKTRGGIIWYGQLTEAGGSNERVYNSPRNECNGWRYELLRPSRICKMLKISNNVHSITVTGCTPAAHTHTTHWLADAVVTIHFRFNL